MSKGAYVGVHTIYQDETKSYTPENFEYFFEKNISYQNGDYLPKIVELPNSSSAAIITVTPNVKTAFVVEYTAKVDINDFSINYTYTVPTGSQAALQINDTSISDIDVLSDSGSWSGDLAQGDIFKIIYLINTDSETANIDILTETSSTIFIPGYDAGNVARKISKMYVGVETDVPIYEDTTNTVTYDFTYDNRALFFGDNAGNTTSNWALSANSSGGIKLIPNNFGVNSSTAAITLTALKDLTNVTISGIYYTETNYDKISLVVNGTTKLNAVSGTVSSLTNFYTGDLVTGQTIILQYVKDSSQHASSESSTYFIVDCDDITITTTSQEIIGYETKPVARKIKKGYLSVDGIAQLFYGPTSYSYTGAYTETSVIVDGNTPYTLLTLTGSGSLNISGDVEYWMCAAGQNGTEGVSYANPGYVPGPGGGGGKVESGILSKGTHVVTIGAAGGGNTSIGSLIAENTSILKNGESGGGGCIYYMSGSFTTISQGTGSGETTIPFQGRITEGFNNYKHSAGGGGGILVVDDGTIRIRAGGTGGSNGSNGGEGTTSTSLSGALGGDYGGGQGGAATAQADSNGKAATFYGSGGGGGGAANISTSTFVGTGGSGYQGVVYILFPSA